MMMNIVGICLVVSTLLVAEVWTPTPIPKDDVILKNGHRVVVVEYDLDGRPNTKVSISPTTKHGQEEDGGEGKKEGAFGGVKERVKETASVLPNIGQGISEPKTTLEGGEPEDHATPGELICDAFGRCTHKIAGAIGKAKDRLSRVTGEAGEAREQVKDSVAEKAREAGDTVSEKAREFGQAVSEKAGDVGEAAAQKAHDVKEAAVEAVARKAEETKEAVADKAQWAKGKAMDKAQGAKDMGAHKVQEAKGAVTDLAQEVRDPAAHKVHETKQMVGDKTQEAKQDAAHKVQTAWEVAKGGMRRAVAGGAAALSPSKTGSTIGVVGVATAYGTCVWVTFVLSYVLATVLGRQQFGLVQSKIYPVYFKVMSASILAGLTGHVLGRRKRLFSDAAEMWQAFNLLASLFMVETNAYFLEPRATKAMFERMKAEKEEGRGRESLIPDQSIGEVEPTAARTGGQAAAESPEQQAVRQRMTTLGDRLRRLNLYSSWLNILTLMSLTWHLAHLGHRLSLAC